MEREALLDLLKEVTVLCRDDGVRFDRDCRDRIRVIKKKLAGTDYQCTAGRISLLFHKRPLHDYGEGALVISSHIDCWKGQGDEGITRCFSERKARDVLRGTYDNAVTNAAVLSLMLEDKLPDNVIVAFTGDAGGKCRGAYEVTRTMENNNICFFCMVLDVTHAGFMEKYLFTIENALWNREAGRKVVRAAVETTDRWAFVPEDPEEIPEFMPRERIYYCEAEQDESWEYFERDTDCFSFCLPVRGDMRSDAGVKVKLSSLEAYIDMLAKLASLTYIHT